MDCSGFFDVSKSATWKPVLQKIQERGERKGRRERSEEEGEVGRSRGWRQTAGFRQHQDLSLHRCSHTQLGASLSSGRTPCKR